MTESMPKQLIKAIETKVGILLDEGPHKTVVRLEMLVLYYTKIEWRVYIAIVEQIDVMLQTSPQRLNDNDDTWVLLDSSLYPWTMLDDLPIVNPCICLEVRVVLGSRRVQRINYTLDQIIKIFPRPILLNIECPVNLERLM